ncbi:armadillo-type protein [Mycena latifolia]|nr:armadillo-type protein [Mycena latifolia]
MCRLLAVLGDHDATLPAVLGVRPYVRLVTLLRDENVDVTWRALWALKSISISIEGAQAAIAANVLDSVPDLLRSSSAGVREWACVVLAVLGEHDSIRSTIVRMGLCPQLVSLLRDENVDVTWRALWALKSISESLEAAEAAIAANVLDCVPDLLRSSNAGVREWACVVLAVLGEHDSISSTIVRMKLWRQLVSLLHDENVDVTWRALWALKSISESLEAAEAAIAANVLDCVPDLLRSSSAGVREWTCVILAVLGEHDSIRSTIVRMKLWPQLVSLLSDVNVDVTWRALWALKSISGSLEAAEASIAANVLDHLPGLLQSSSAGVREWTCVVLAVLARHDSIRGLIVRVPLCPQLVSLLRDENIEVTWRALWALKSISELFEGAQAAIAANVLDCMPDLLRSSSAGVREWTCLVLAVLATHSTIRDAIVRIKPCPQLVSLLSDENFDVTRRALWALESISKSLEAAKAAMAVHVLDYLPGMLGSTGVRRRTCKVLAELAWHDSIRATIVEIKLCPQLVSLLNTNPPVCRNAARALAQICKSTDGATHILGTDFLAHVIDLMESTDHEVQVQTCIILRNLKRYTSGVHQIISDAS